MATLSSCANFKVTPKNVNLIAETSSLEEIEKKENTASFELQSVKRSQVSDSAKMFLQ